MKYADLQKKAKSMGLKFVGVSTENLEKSIATASEKLTPESEEPTNANTAIVYKGKHEFRRYTKEAHGKGFAKLAKEFAFDREDCIVKLVEAKPQTKCPSCGHEFDA